MDASPAPASDASPTPPYSALAVGYDVVMAHVDYERWADHIERLFARHEVAPARILELGCGTGSLALSLQPRGPYAYRATDRAPVMVAVARRKALASDAAVTFAEADFTDFVLPTPVDAVLLLYDGLNYVTDPADLRSLFGCVSEALRPGGVFIVDQSTPANSVNNTADFDDAGTHDGFTYERRSTYDAARRLHTTTFRLHVDGRSFTETHVQRAYERQEIAKLIDAQPFQVIGAYDGFTTNPATDASERIHWVLQKPADAPST